MNTRWCFGFASNLEIDARTTARTSPRCHLGEFELRQKRRRFGVAMFEHPSNKMPLLVREFAVRIAHGLASRKTGSSVLQPRRASAEDNRVSTRAATMAKFLARPSALRSRQGKPSWARRTRGAAAG